MAKKTKSLRAAIDSILHPAMAELGFSIDYPDYRRFRADTVHLGSVLFWKYGGAFTLEFAIQDGPFTDWSGKDIAHADLRVEHIGPFDRARIATGSKATKLDADYFKYDHIADDPAAIEALVQEVAGYLPQAEDWFRDRSIGPNMLG